MALRVLLGDESATIKKVIQLALQDFSVEVRSVHLGLDIIDVAKTFHPHIVFMDVLLQKKNGYEVCAEIKSDPELSGLPVVLMWSSFMSLDEDKYRACQADARLEKPFEVDDLRNIVKSLVPIAKENKISAYLNFSPQITQEFREEIQKQAGSTPKTEPTKAPQQQPAPQKVITTPPPASSTPLEMTASSSASPASAESSLEKESWSMEDFENITEFSLDDNALTDEEPMTEASSLFQKPQGDPWASQNLDEFRVDLNDSDEEDFVITTLEEPPASAMEFTKVDQKVEPPMQGLELSKPLHDVPAPPTKEGEILNPSIRKMVDDYMHRAFHTQLEARLEKALRELLPEVATRVIKEEIERLTRNLE
jgi:two-component system cell cycle response regulator